MGNSTAMGRGAKRRTAKLGRRGRANLFAAGLVGLAGLVVLFGVTIWHRNDAQVKFVELRLQREFVEPLKDAITESGNILPLEFPSRHAAHRVHARRYHYPAPEEVWALRRASEPVVVGYAGRLALFIRRDVYVVVEFHEGGLCAQRVSESDFFRRIADQQQWVKDERATLDTRRHRLPELP